MNPCCTKNLVQDPSPGVQRQFVVQLDWKTIVSFAGVNVIVGSDTDGGVRDFAGSDNEHPLGAAGDMQFACPGGKKIRSIPARLQRQIFPGQFTRSALLQNGGSCDAPIIV